jgi:hypothetical protein
MPVIVGLNKSLIAYPYDFTQDSQLTWVLEGKRLQQNRVHHAENGGNCADAQSYGQESDQGKSRRPAQGADAQSKIQEQGLHGISLRHQFLMEQARIRPNGPVGRSNLFN